MSRFCAKNLVASLTFLYLPAISLRVFAALPNCNARPSELSIRPTTDIGSVGRISGEKRRGLGELLIIDSRRLEKKKQGCRVNGASEPAVQ